jgi:hypothetical protein
LDPQSKPGQIRIGPHSPRWEGWTGPWWFAPLFLIVAFSSPFLWVIILSILEAPPDRFALEFHPTSFSIPSNPLRPGCSATFVLRHPKSTDERELVFSYERIKVIPITSSQIHHALATGAVVFGKGEAKKSSFTGRTLVSDEDTDPYIIYGDVDVRCSFVQLYDVGMVTARVEPDRIRYLDVDMTPGLPRGPPHSGASRTLTEDAEDMFRRRHFMETRTIPKIRPVRTVYVVGRVLSFHGPAQKHQSFMQTNILDLSPLEKESMEFAKEQAHWEDQIKELASTALVPIEQLKRFSGKTVETTPTGIYDVEAQHPVGYVPGMTKIPGSRPESEFKEHPIEHPRIEIR